MLSDQTTRNIEDAFRRVAVATLVRDSGDVCNVVSAREGSPAEVGASLLLLTISSFVFRLVVLFQLASTQATRDYYVAGNGERTLDESFAEIANLCCGALSRELSAGYRHLAMSIPYRLEPPCLAFVDVLKPRLRTAFDITINQAARLRVTLCLSCDRPIEFASSSAEVAHTGGALEMF